ncbi:MAG TPA: hypothetical protein VGC87_13030 [Pyrinomonadaceae bacterium]|jgi:hypothetical protein
MKADDFNMVWEAFPGTDLSTLALPDYYSNYFAYSYETLKYPNTGLRITGDFPDARYLSFNIYSTRTGTSLGAFSDYQIRTQDGNVNPFVAGSDASAQKRQYVINVQPTQPTNDATDAEQTTPGSDTPENLLTFNPSELKAGLLTIIIRYYVPQGEQGRVKLPKIEPYPVTGNEQVTLPPPYPQRMELNEPILHKRLAKIFQTVSGDELRFYHAGGGGQFNNADNLYLICGVENVDGRDNVVILKVRPPAYPRTNEEFDKTAVRYWSFNQGNPDTSTPYGMKDEEFRRASDGFVYIVMGDDEVVRGRAEQGGYNYMPWKANKKQAVILYRNMLTVPQYRGSLARVPVLTLPTDEATIIAYEAPRHINEHAPVGRKVTAREFNDSYGGMPSPGFA